MSPCPPQSHKPKPAACSTRLVCVLFVFPWIFSAELCAQNPPKLKGPSVSQVEDVRTQAKRIETLAKQDIGAAVEILKELLKSVAYGDAALKSAAAKTEAAMKRIKGDSASFDAELTKAKQQLKSGIEELKKIDEASDIITDYIADKLGPLEKNLQQSDIISKTSLAVLESTLNKINSWKKKFAIQEEANGRNDAVAHIKNLIEKEIAGLTQK
jgi:hypothetical protein